MNERIFKSKTWYDKSDTANRIPISHENLNRIEMGIEEAFSEIMHTDLKNLAIQKITSSCEWIAPKAAKQKFKVLCVGGGGGGGRCINSRDYYLGGGGGGGGYFNIAEVKIPEGTSVDIICGAYGATSSDGGQTSFGDYLIASGGKAGADADITGTIVRAGNGGDGSSGGGGGYAYPRKKVEASSGSGGNANLFGSGGVGGVKQYNSDYQSTYGIVGTAGNYGGSGGDYINEPKKGREVGITFSGCFFDYNKVLSSSKLTDPKQGYGSGGIFSNGGLSGWGSGTMNTAYAGGGGGGGYFGNGGSALTGGKVNNSNSSGGSGGGGGGGCFAKGGDGADGSIPYDNDYCYSGGGGGGGFFCDGSDGSYTSGGGGGGFFSRNGGVLIMYTKEEE